MPCSRDFATAAGTLEVTAEDPNGLLSPPLASDTLKKKKKKKATDVGGVAMATPSTYQFLTTKESSK